MDHPFGGLIDFHNRLAALETYDYAHLIHPDRRYIEPDDIIALLKDFRDFDEVYQEYVDELDVSLRLMMERLRDPVVTVIKGFDPGSPPDMKDLVEKMGLIKLISYPNDLRDAVKEQMRRFEEALDEKMFLARESSDD
ncbi:MAG: hypothetical protein APF80_11950 [Alphaproteobacteria bacterium BRH_c36]|nr:MAG: hypothetical protein APF80_11950 [Alphaproteobacteria bacterium BRH_c36]